MKNEKITERSVDFAKWYTDVIKAESPYCAVNVSMLNWNG